MAKNIGIIDKIIRVIVGLILVYYAVVQYQASLVLAIVLGIVGLILLITSFTGSCFVYKIFGISTNKENEGQQAPPDNQQQTM